MSERDVILLTGVVVHMARDTYRVRVDLGGRSHEVVARLCGRMFKNKIRVLVHDRVEVEVSPYDLTKGRIVKRPLAAADRRAAP
jgi:translation initiation factor IF-1